MGYYVRAFCTSERVPSIKEIFEWAETQGRKFDISEDYKDIDLNSSDWEQVDILYKDNKKPFTSEINQDDGTEECLMREEIKEFNESLSDIRYFFNFNKKKVQNHLERTKYIVSNQLLSDIDDDGYNANTIFMEYFVAHCGGMVQADGEGFYDKGELIVKLY